MSLSRLENFLKNAEGNILYVSPSDFDATDSFENQGNSLTRPFKTIQRALIEAARFSYQSGRNNDKIDKTTILVYPGTHYIDNRPGYSLTASGSTVSYKKRTGATTWTSTTLDEFGLGTNYDILDTNNDLYKFNSINGGVILPRGTSIIGYDLRKTKIRPLYIPNPEDSTVENSSIFNVTGTCYFSIFTFMDADPTKTVFKDYTDNRFVPNFSHHKLVSFAYADGVNKVVLGGTEQTDLTDLDMYYYKVARAYGDLTGRGVIDYPSNNDFETSVDEYRIVGSLQTNPIGISSIFGGNGITNPRNVITVTTKDFLTGDDKPHGLSLDSPVLISGIIEDSAAFNGSFTVKEVVGLTTFTYSSTAVPANANPSASVYESGIVTVEADTVSSASPYVFNCSIRSVYGLCGLWADGAKADGFKSMVVAQFTGVSLQKDDNAFLIYKNGKYESNATLDINSTERPLHINGNAIYKPDYESTHIRVSNNGFVQSVSIFAIGFSKHFLTESGGDMSITNSNSNFGAISLESTGFRNESFDRDDVGYITHIIPPKEIEDIESEITWLSLDVPKTISAATTSKLYLYNYDVSDVLPPHQVDSYRIGAKTDDNLNLTVVIGTAQTTYTTPILMPVPSGTGISSKKTYTVTRTGTQNNITNNTFTLSSSHQLYNGEKVRVFSDTSQAPDGINVDTIYYAITTGLLSTEIKLAYSLNDALAGKSITGINNNGGILTIVSSVTDKLPGDLAHPVQYDTTQNQWFITGSATTSTNQIYNTIVGFGTTTLGNETASTFVTRKVDTRSIEDRIYKVRYVIPKEFTSARPPTAGFILQETKTVGVSTISFDNSYTLTDLTPPAYLRNEKIISNASVGTVSNGKQTVTITTELPHGFSVGDKAKIQKVRSTNNILGVGLTSTYNGSYRVLSVPNTKQFTYELSGVKINPGTYTNLINERDTRQERDQLPLVSREEYSGNYFIYRVNTIKNHIPGTDGQDGIYNLTVLASNVKPLSTVGFGVSEKVFNQDVKNLYPQIDRDNFNSDPIEAISFADIKTLGKVVSGDKKRSITKEAINSFVKNSRIGFGITGISTSGIAGTTITVFTDVEHTLNSIKQVSISAAGAGYGNTTIYASNLTGGSGSNASARANLAAGTVQSVSIVDPGSAYVVGNTLTVSGPPGVTPSVNSTLSVTQINNNVGDGIQLSGFNQTDLNGLYKILSVPSSKSFTIYNPAGVSAYSQNTNGRLPVAVLSSKGIGITSFRFDSVSTGIVTVTTSLSHGLLPGNKFSIVGSGHTIYDKSFIVKENVGIKTFTFYVGIVTQRKASTTGTLLKSTMSANALNLTRGEENLGSRASYIYAGITTTLTTTLTSTSTSVGLSSAAGFNRGDYVLINTEILRLASSPTVNVFTVLRHQFSTYNTTAEIGAQVKKIKVLPMEVRRPSFMRASGHTFEYLGYGPGNYSTGMPQKQSRTLSEDDILTSQSREQAGGTVVYTGMNDIGEFYSGSKKTNSATGEEKVIDAPIITFTGDDAQGENQNRSSGIFDDVLAKERITVEGGDDGNQSSQFYGPVNFTRKLTNTSDEGINTKNLFIKGTASQGKLITVGLGTPSFTSSNAGDISLKSNPTDGYIGQVYLNNKWKRFGLISDSADILDIKVDKLGVGDASLVNSSNDFANAKFYVGGNALFQNVTFLQPPSFASGVTLNDVNFTNIFINKTAKFTGTGGTSYVIYVDNPSNLGAGNTSISRLYNLEVANHANVFGNLGIGTTSAITKLDVRGNSYISGNLGIGSTSPGQKLDVDGNINLVSSGNYIQKTFADNTEEYILRGPTLSSWYPTITYTRSSGSSTRGFRFGSHDNSGNRSDWVSFWNGNVGIGSTNPGNKLVVNGTIGIDGSSSTAGRTLLSSSASGFVLNHNDNSPIILQTQSTDRLTIGAGGTITATANNALTETRGTFLRIANVGNGDAVISWDNTYNNVNQRWYAGIDVSDSYAWKLARPIPANFNSENFDAPTSGGNLAETKLKIDTSGNATFLGNLTSISGSLTLNTNKFTVAGSTGNTLIGGTLDVTGSFAVNTNKFTASASTGDVTASGKITANSFSSNNGITAGGSIAGASLSAGTGAITGGSITGSSLSAGTGAITGGAITGSSLSAGTGAITGGAISGSSLNTGTGAITGGSITGTSLSAGTGTISAGGAITGGSFVKSGGTSSQFLKADGSIDTNTYITSSGSASNATNANNINISAIDTTDTTTSIVLVGNQVAGYQSTFIDSGLTYNGNTNALSVSGAITGSSLSAGTGAITGGAITGSSLNTGTGAITGGSITGSSLSAGTGAITGGAITGSSIAGSSLSIKNGTTTTCSITVGGAITGSSLNTGTGAITGGSITGSSLSAGTGTITGGAITGSSLSAGTGAITGGAITGSSLNTGTGAITGGAISGSSLSASGALTGSSLNTGTGAITGGAITGSSIAGSSLSIKNGTTTTCSITVTGDITNAGSITAQNSITGTSLSAGTGTISAGGAITGGSFIKTGGSPNQYLMADGTTSTLNLNSSPGYQLYSLGVGTAPSGTQGEIRATNDITAFYSDLRLKENITPIANALSKVCSLRGVTYNANDVAASFGYTKEEQVGVIAQEVEKVLPQIVKAAPFDIAKDDDGNEYSASGENYKTVKYEKLVPLLIEAIKELNAEIEELKKAK